MVSVCCVCHIDDVCVGVGDVVVGGDVDVGVIIDVAGVGDIGVTCYVIAGVVVGGVDDVIDCDIYVAGVM